MREIILQVDDTIPFEQLVTLLAPYIKNAEIKQTVAELQYKIWDGTMDCLHNPWKADSFVPFLREELYEG